MKIVTVFLMMAFAATTMAAPPMGQSVHPAEQSAPPAKQASPPAEQAGDPDKGCKLCREHFDNCKKSCWWWFDPAACDRSCQIETCHFLPHDLCKHCGFNIC
ncbi:hypothetical protein BU24DRAFT_464365 [Aaosphaeria arxii CBS 175.79]|uniref:Uncharacterized protein n=1 Tax=Aaosphaeria arxii CBS 175.79 TaxID=1450172 RepID=A0A6A5XL68_9PLEO|nr:uncharacterized protein BU24DRAFT_464365 [Aaosphaeria arxii CBS 175.79]KAF2013599.1 hypothetical protein BU24DRAFT_464365 [Aaosphaeria arxii CBS 175.79]